MAQKQQTTSAENRVDSMLNQEYSRRNVLKMGAAAGVALPLIITLKPTEARADETTGS